MNKVIYLILLSLSTSFSCCDIDTTKSNKLKLPPYDSSEDKVSLFLKELKKHSLKDENKSFNYEVSLEYSKKTLAVERIRIRNLKFDSLPGIIREFSQLKALYANYCDLNSLKGFKNLNLITLDLSFNSFESLKEGELSLFNNLMNLNLSNNLFKGKTLFEELPPILDKLDISDNEISNIAFTNPGQYPFLTNLVLAGNKITTLDTSFYSLPNLHNLDIHGNPLEKIEVSKLKSLRVLRIDKSFKFSENDLKYIQENNIQIIYY